MNQKLAYNPKKTGPKINLSDSLIEALRHLENKPEDWQKKTSRSGELKPNQALNLAEPDLKKKEKQFKQFHQEFLNIQQQEKSVWQQKEQEVELQISVILEELKK